LGSDKKLELLATVPLFAHLRGRELERVGQLAEEIDVPVGKVLIRQGAIGDEFFVIVDGRVRVERDGKVLKTRGPGEFVGEIALIDERPRTATVTTETPCRLLVLGHREFHTLLAEHPDLQLPVLKALAERVRQLEPERAD
jgi:CRP-like cAMP-binding protein